MVTAVFVLARPPVDLLTQLHLHLLGWPVTGIIIPLDQQEIAIDMLLMTYGTSSMSKEDVNSVCTCSLFAYI
jgi:hypothetical protein